MRLKRICVGFLAVVAAIFTVHCGAEGKNDTINYPEQNTAYEEEELTDDEIVTEEDLEEKTEELPEYQGESFAILNGNVPAFSEEDLTTEPFEYYSDLDELGRCGVAYANICREIMPTEERGAIGQIKPTGWHTVKYDCVDGKYLYNRCHLIGYQLAGENANEKNLITGTRSLNIDGMLPFENQVADYVQETGNHVLYRVTPVFEGNNLLASGVIMEGLSVEDHGKGVKFCVYAYNAQEGVRIDYATGDSALLDEQEIKDSGAAEDATEETASQNETKNSTYVLNIHTGKFHLPDCPGVSSMKEENRRDFYGTREEAIDMGYEPCGTCKP